MARRKPVDDDEDDDIVEVSQDELKGLVADEVKERLAEEEEAQEEDDYIESLESALLDVEAEILEIIETERVSAAVAERLQGVLDIIKEAVPGDDGQAGEDEETEEEEFDAEPVDA
ncbi:MAG TPA: hypothetical protein VKA60_10605 [Blastocatellia bacterium]|nr:hypothetical protein [Blastocatellia bacterium]